MTGEVTKVVMTKKLIAVVTIEVPAKKAHLIPIEPVVVTIQKAQTEIAFGGEDEEAEGDE